jgi:hypothetical protein
MRLTHRFALSFALALLACCCSAPPPEQQQGREQQPAAAFPSGAVVDLSHAYDEQTVYWLTAEKTFKLEKDFKGVTNKGYFYAANNFSITEHGGTHLDAPIHFAAGKNTADRIVVRALGLHLTSA